VVTTQRVHTPQPSEPRRPDFPLPEPAGYPPKLVCVWPTTSASFPRAERTRPSGAWRRAPALL